MPLDCNGCWYPKLSEKQLALYNCTKRYILACGPRRSGKSWGNLHRIIRHLWETPNARFAVFCKTVKNAKSGVWADFIQYIIPEWLEANLASPHAKFEYTVEPKSDGATRMSYCKIRNYWGGESELQLYSLDYDDDVEAKVKGTRYSGIYFSEIDQFRSRQVFSATVEQLRMPGLDFQKHLWIADCNPADRRQGGRNHFAHKIWYEERVQKDHPHPEFRDNLALFEIMIEDNPYLDKREIDNLKANYASDPDLYARYILGKWTEATTTSIFADVFIPNLHVQGDCSLPNKGDWRILLPDSNCIELFSGWDLGDVNHAAAIIQKRIGRQGEHEVTIFDALDEVVIIDKKVSISDFTEMFLDRMDYWEEYLKETYGREHILWRHWSDRSAFRYKSAGDSEDELIVQHVSDGRIKLHSADNQRGNVRPRVRLLRKLLFEKRYFVSALCRHEIEMLQGLSYESPKSDVVERASPFKHKFDATTYILSNESPHDLERRIRPEIGAHMVSIA